MTRDQQLALMQRHKPLPGTGPSITTTELESVRAVRVPKKDGTPPPDLTPKYLRPGGTMNLRELQNAFLHELEQVAQNPHPSAPRGGIGMLGVGGGKTLISILAPLALGQERATLLLPANMEEAFTSEYEKYGRHWKRCKTFRVMSYEKLSRQDGEDLLKIHNPGVLICDEAHALADPDSARTRKWLRYLAEHPQCYSVLLSGTMSGDGLKSFEHLLRVTLRGNSPLPAERRELDSWASIIDKKGIPLPGAWGVLRPLYARGDGKMEDEQEAARKVFGLHLGSTKGVIAQQSTDTCQATLLVHQVRTHVPESVVKALADFEATWTRPDGEEIKTALEAFRLRRQLSQGFYYRWEWPEGKVDKEWLEKRARWGKACRSVLARQERGLDSPLQVVRALDAGYGDVEAAQALEGWRSVKMRPAPPTVPVWIDDFIIKAAVAWAKKVKKDAIIWYNERAVGDMLGEYGIPVFGPGQMPRLDGKVIACSIRAHGTGKNLQKYAKNLLLAFPPSGRACEQLFGRTHRYGQEAHEVLVDFIAETAAMRDSVRNAVLGAKYIQDVERQEQKLLLATWHLDFDRFERLESKGAVGGDGGDEDDGIDEDDDGAYFDVED